MKETKWDGGESEAQAILKLLEKGFDPSLHLDPDPDEPEPDENGDIVIGVATGELWKGDPLEK